MGLICDYGLPPAVAALPWLNYMRLDQNPALAGPIPPEWAALKHLSYCNNTGPPARPKLKGYDDDCFIYMPTG